MATKWLSASDPYFAQFPGTQDEGGFQPGQYESQIAGLNSPAMWEPLAKKLGFTGEIMGVVGTDAEGGALTDYSNEFKNFIAQKKAEGYDLVTDASKIDQRKQTIGLRLPSGQVVGERTVDAGGFGEFLQGAMMMFGPVFGGQIFNALMGGGAAAGSALGIAEGMAPGVLAPATAAEMAGVNALLGGGAGGVLTAADLASLSPDVMGGVSPDVGYENLGQTQQLADKTLTAPTTAATGAGIMEGMVPGGLTSAGIPATLAEAGAAGAVAAGAGAGGSLLDKALGLIKSPVGQAVVGGVGSVVGGVLEANAAEKAAQTQSQAAQNALALEREMFEYQKGLLEPYRTAGTKALERMSGAMGFGGQGSQQQMLEMDPGYGFRLGEGLKALERMQASRGNFLSGGAMKAGQRFAQDTASQEYDRAFGRLADIAGIGRSTSTQLGNAASGFGTSAGNIMGQEANALAAGRMGRGSAYSNAIGGALGSYQNYLNRQQEERLVRDIFRRPIGG